MVLDNEENDKSRLEDFEWEIHFQLASWPATFDYSEAILALARQHQEQSRILSACACIIMVAVLEQATRSKLHYAVATAEHMGYELETYADLLEKPGELKRRVDAVPVIFSQGRMELNSSSDKVRALYQLIRFRNAIIHISEGVTTIKTPDPRVRLENGQFKIDVPPPLVLWDRVTLSDACKFRDAVGVYLREVIEPEEIGPGEIVKEVSQ